MDVFEAIRVLKDLENEYADLRFEHVSLENKLWLEVDFKELGLTNQKLREAYIQQQLGLSYGNELEKLKVKINNLRRTYNALLNMDKGMELSNASRYVGLTD